MWQPQLLEAGPFSDRANKEERRNQPNISPNVPCKQAT